MRHYFIPAVEEINGVKVPTTPFYANKGETISLGDVIETNVNEDGKEVEPNEITLIALIDGCYVSVCKNERTTTPLALIEPKCITILGNVERNPELLNLLTD